MTRDSILFTSDNTFYDLTTDSEGIFFLIGAFDKVNSKNTPKGIARFTSSNQPDLDFNPQGFERGVTVRIEIQSDGK